jgi:hypothetical protein
MAETIVWCIMIYNISFYIMLVFYMYNSIIENIPQMENCFKGLVILGFLNLFNNFNTSRR